MKKEKTIRTYQRRTKSGKVVTVKQHTAKYDAADRAKEMASKKGAGDELAAKKGMPDHNLPMNEYLEELKKLRKGETPEEAPVEKETKKSSPSAEKKSKSVKSTKTTKNAATTQANGVSASDFKSWYHFNDWDKPKKSWPAEVRAADAAIRKQLGSKKAYDDYCAQIDGSYSKSGHNKAFKSFGGGVATSTSAKSSPKIKSEKISKVSDTPYSAATKKKWNATYLKAAAKAGIDETTLNKMGDVHGNLTDSSMRLFAGHSGAKKAYSDAKKEEKALYASLTDSQKAFYRKHFDYDVSKESVTKSKESKSVKDPKNEFTQPRHSLKYKYKGETYYIKRKNVGGLVYKNTDVFNSKGEKLGKDEAAIIKAAQQKSAERADKRGDRRSNRSKEWMSLNGWGRISDEPKSAGKSSTKADTMGKKTDEAKTAKTGAVTWTTWKTQMQNKYQGQGKNAEILSLLGINHSMRLAPSGYTKGALTTAIKELRKQNSPTSAKNNIKRLEKLLEQKNVEKGKRTSSAKKPTTSVELKKSYEAALAKEKKDKLSKNRKEARALYAEHNTSHREVAAFMKAYSPKRGWSWDRNSNSFVTSRMPNGLPMRGFSEMSLATAIKKMEATRFRERGGTFAVENPSKAKPTKGGKKLSEEEKKNYKEYLKYNRSKS